MALIPPKFFDCVVAIGTPLPDGERAWVATGFIYGDLITLEPKPLYQPFLVTNRHVLESLSIISLRFNPQAGVRPTDIDLTAEDKERVTYHPNTDVDLAVLPLAGSYIRRQGLRLEFFQRNNQAASLSDMSKLGITEGDGVFVMGFPMGLVGVERSAVIVRAGVIARLQDTYAGYEPDFLIDSSVFPGNSGGPVLSKPEPVGISGTTVNNAALLIGVIQSYIAYSETAISQQTGQIRAIFTENSGLARILPIDLVEETVAHAAERLPDLKEIRANPIETVREIYHDDSQVRNEDPA